MNIERQSPIDIKTEKSVMLRVALREAVDAKPADVLLLSGGIDSSALAALNPSIPAVTVVLEGQGQDLKNSQRVAEYLKMHWPPIELSTEQAVNNLKELVKLTETYDPALLNCIPIYTAMKYAAGLGMRRIRTGDFADTLFRGYLFIQDVDLAQHLDKLLPHLTLASSRVGQKMGLSMHYPYLYPKVIDVAKSLSREDNIVAVEAGIPGDVFEMQQGRTTKQIQNWSKITLRQALLGLLPTEIIFRQRADLEFGSGTYKIEDYLEKLPTSQRISEFENQGIRFWNKMHAGLYYFYKEAELNPPPVRDKKREYGCKWCSGAVEKGRHHCLTCGAYPADKTRRKVITKTRKRR